MTFPTQTANLTINPAIVTGQQDDIFTELTRCVFIAELDALADNLEDIDSVGWAGFDEAGETLDNLVNGLVTAYMRIVAGEFEENWQVGSSDRLFITVFSNDDVDVDAYQKVASLAIAADMIPALGDALGIYGTGIVTS